MRSGLAHFLNISVLRTRIVRAEGQHADHTTTAQPKLFDCFIFLQYCDHFLSNFSQQILLLNSQNSKFPNLFYLMTQSCIVCSNGCVHAKVQREVQNQLLQLQQQPHRQLSDHPLSIVIFPHFYFIRVSITVRPASCLTGLDLTKQVNLSLIKCKQSS